MDNGSRQKGVRTSADAQAAGLSRMAMTLFLLALGMLFAASMVGYLVVRTRPGLAAEEPAPAGRA
jgi:heme/copper-type cytochrome/quinol oxidase subunit 3